MKTEIIHSPKHDSNLFFSDYFHNQDRNLVLMTHFRENRSSNEAANSLILQKVINIDIESKPWEEIPGVLKALFTDLNWELFAFFKKYDSLNEGVSLLLAVVEKSSVCYVNCGRFVCGLSSEGSISELGKKWENLHVTTKEELGLLGSIADDIIIRPDCIDLTENSIFFAFPYELLSRVNVSGLQPSELISRFKAEYDNAPFPYCILSSTSTRIKYKNPWYNAKRFRFSVALMLITLLFSLYYLFLGKNTVEDRLQITREQFQLTVRNIDFLKLQEILPLDYGLLFVPQRNIELTVEWESLLPFSITNKPHFDMKQLFLVSHNKLFIYDKKNKKNTWKSEFEHEIVHIEILDANLLLLTLKNNTNLCLKRDSGEVVWSHYSEETLVPQESSPYNPIQISLEKDMRLNTGIILLPEPESLTILNILNGDTLYYYEAENMITHISDFDFLEKSIYMVKSDKLYKLRFDIRN
jgi:hypothetical protein